MKNPKLQTATPLVLRRAHSSTKISGQLPVKSRQEQSAAVKLLTALARGIEEFSGADDVFNSAEFHPARRQRAGAFDNITLARCTADAHARAGNFFRNRQRDGCDPEDGSAAITAAGNRGAIHAAMGSANQCRIGVLASALRVEETVQGGKAPTVAIDHVQGAAVVGAAEISHPKERSCGTLEQIAHWIIRVVKRGIELVQDRIAGAVLGDAEEDAGIETAARAGRAIEVAISGFDHAAFGVIAIGAAGIEVMQYRITAAIFVQTENSPGGVVTVAGTVPIEPAIASFHQSGVSIEQIAAGGGRIIENHETRAVAVESEDCGTVRQAALERATI